MGQYWLDGREVTKEEYENSYVEVQHAENTESSKNNSKNKIIELSTFKLYTLGFISVILLILTLYMVNSAIAESNDIVQLYQSLSDKTTKSKDDFNKKIVFITVDSNGDVTVKVEHKEDLVEPGEDSSDDSNSELVIDIPADAQEVANKLKDKYGSKAEAMGLAYSIIEPKLGANAAIGLMANIKHEGNFGLVEGKYLKPIPEHSDGQRMEVTLNVGAHRKFMGIGCGYSFQICDRNGLNALKELGTDYSCGLGIIQWSKGRRMNLIQVYEDILGSSNTIDQSIMIAAEVKMMSNELEEGGHYYRGVSKQISENGVMTPEAWAEAFCDVYEAPRQSCNAYKEDGVITNSTGKYTNGVKMSYLNNPSLIPSDIDWQCRERAKTAREIAEVLGGS